MADKIKSAYRTSQKIYDAVLTQSTVFSRLYNKLFWGGTDDTEIVRKMLACIPNDFRGTVLDVPAGTAVFTQEKWRSLANASITCLDYSEDMIAQAKSRLADCTHVSCVQGDVGHLPLETESVDIVLSMNGFHAFPDKPQAFRETYRVLKPGGTFIACFYIAGESRVTDWLVKNILAKKGWFTPPFQTQSRLKEFLEKTYRQTDFHTDGSIAYFSCTK